MLEFAIIPSVLVVFLGLALWAIRSERKSWNKGVCTQCNKDIWVSFDMDSSGATGYKCNSCGASTWISWGAAYR